MSVPLNRSIPALAALASFFLCPTSQAAPSGAELVGYVTTAGSARDVVVETRENDAGELTDLAFVTSDEFGLAIFDVTDPGRPVALGATTPGFGNGLNVDVQDSLAVVAAGPEGLYVVDVSDPTDPRTVGWLDADIRDVALLEAPWSRIAGRYAYARVGMSGNPATIDLAIVDLREPSDPQFLGRFVLPGGDQVEIAGTWAFVTTGSRLEIFDVRDPLQPKRLSSMPIPNGARELAVARTFAYVGNFQDVHIVDATDPGAPFIAATLPFGSFDLSVTDDGMLYSIGGGLRVADVSTARLPRVLGSAADRSATGVAALGPYALMVSPQAGTIDVGGLFVVDATFPTAPKQIASVPSGAGGSLDVAVSRGLGVVAAGTSGLHVLDLGNPMRPEPIGRLQVDVRGAALLDSFAYVRVSVPGNPAHIDLASVDLRDPTAPRILDQVFVSGGDRVVIEGARAYVTTGRGIEIYSIGNPFALDKLASIDVPDGGRDLAVSDGYAYVGNRRSLQIVDVRDPAKVAVMGSLAGGISGVAVDGNRVYTVGGGLRVIDVSDPTQPSLLGTIGDFGSQDVVVAQGRVLTVSPYTPGGVFVYDVSNPANPTLLDQVEVPGPAFDLAVDGGFVYAGDTTSFIDVIELFE